MKKYIVAILLVIPLMVSAHGGVKEEIITADISFLQSMASELNKPAIITQSEAVRSTVAERALINKLKFRQGELVELAKQSPALALAYVIPAKNRIRQTVDAQKYIEQSSTLSGTLEVIHVDDFEYPENSRFAYAVNNGGVRTNVYAAKEVSFRSGAKVSFQGYKLNATEFLTDGKGVSFGAMPDIGAVGKQRMLVLLVNSTTQPGQPITPKQAEDYINNGQFQKFIKEASYGQTWFEAKAYGWLTLTAPGQVLGCGVPSKINPEVQAFLAKNTISLSNYDRVLFLLTGSADCSEVGKSDVSQAWIGINENSMKEYGHSFSWTYFDAVLAHELGHSLGLRHANGFDCGEKALSGTCTNVEYGNDYDVMGKRAEWSLQYNGFYKEILGWIKPSEILNISASGKYQLGQLESGAAIKKFAKITNPLLSNKGATYFLESRAPIGFDADIPKPTGLLVTRPVVSGGGEISSQLIDTTPSNKTWFDDIKDAGIIAGGNFTDPSTGITISQFLTENTTTTSFSVTVGSPSCIRSGLRLVDKSKGTNVSRSSSQARSLQLVNNDSVSCGASRFDVEVVMPAGWRVVESPKELSFSPGEGNNGILRYTIPSTAALGEQSISVYSINKATGARVFAGTVIVEVFDHVSVSSITPQPVKSGERVTLVLKNHDQYVKKVNLMKSDDSTYISVEIPAQVTQDSITFEVPQKVCIERRNDDCDYDLLPYGEYKLRVYGYGVLEDVPILVGEKVQPPPNIASAISNVKIKDIPDSKVLDNRGVYTLIWDGRDLSRVDIDIYDLKNMYKVLNIVKNLEIVSSEKATPYSYRINLGDFNLPDDIYTIRVTNALDRRVRGSTPKVDIAQYQPPLLGTVELVTGPTLKLITSGDKENALEASFTFKVNAINDIVNLGEYVNVRARNLSTPNSSVQYVSAGITPISGEYTKTTLSGTSVFQILKGKTATFNLKVNFIPEQMLAGNYEASIVNLSTLANKTGKDGKVTGLPFTTNQVTIVGEKSPYIISVNNPVQANLPVIIEGQRFSPVENILITNTQQYKLRGATNNRITFIPSEIGLAPGRYSFQIDSPSGKSNYEWLDIKQPTNAASILNAFWNLVFRLF